jgi:predicted lysophospholipase L1 biosynthesis ABC-type transport system permease subunit
VRVAPAATVSVLGVVKVNVGVGAAVRLGKWETRIVGLLRRVPGDSMGFANLAPRVYLSTNRLAETGLLGRGSIVRYRAFDAYYAGRAKIDDWGATPKAELHVDDIAFAD